MTGAGTPMAVAVALQIVVSQDGLANGADCNSTEGEGIVYLRTAGQIVPLAIPTDEESVGVEELLLESVVAPRRLRTTPR